MAAMAPIFAKVGIFVTVQRKFLKSAKSINSQSMGWRKQCFNNGLLDELDMELIVNEASAGTCANTLRANLWTGVLQYGCALVCCFRVASCCSGC